MPSCLVPLWGAVLMRAKLSSRLPGIRRNPHFWIILTLFTGIILFHYVEVYGPPGTELPSVHFGLTRHAMDRIIFLLPVTYAGYVFRLRWGMVGLAVAALAMLPRAIFISPEPANALVETGAIILAGGLVNLGFDRYHREVERRKQAILQLEAAQQELKSDAQALKRSERRLTAINAVYSAVSQSLELQEVLNAAADKVIEVMDVEATLMYLVDQRTQELVLQVYRGVSGEFAAGVDRLKIGEGFNGQVAQTGEPLLVADASSDPRLTREAVKQEGLEAQLIVPLKSRGEVMGTLCVGVRHPRQFLAEEAELLAAFGVPIGVAIEDAYLYQAEKRIRENLSFYLQQVTTAQEEERKRIARELHDDTAQELVALSRRLDKLSATGTKLSRRDSTLLEEAQQDVDRILEGVRRFSRDLRPSILDDLGLLPALEWLASELRKQFDIAIATAVVGTERRFSPEAELVMFRIAQEALRNTCRHAQASRASVAVEYGEDKTIIRVSDNGKGFELPERLSDLASLGKLGLAGMEERTRLLGGTLSLKSAPDKGTTVTVEVPI